MEYYVLTCIAVEQSVGECYVIIFEFVQRTVEKYCIKTFEGIKQLGASCRIIYHKSQIY